MESNMIPATWFDDRRSGTAARCQVLSDDGAALGACECPKRALHRNTEGCQLVAGGPREARTPGNPQQKEKHPGGVPEATRILTARRISFSSCPKTCGNSLLSSSASGG